MTDKILDCVFSDQNITLFRPPFDNIDINTLQRHLRNYLDKHCKKTKISQEQFAGKIYAVLNLIDKIKVKEVRGKKIETHTQLQCCFK